MGDRERAVFSAIDYSYFCCFCSPSGCLGKASLFRCGTPSAFYMSCLMTKPVFGVSDQVRHEPGCATTLDGRRLEISDKEVEGLYYLCSENVDQLRSSNRTANLHMQKAGSFMTWLI